MSSLAEFQASLPLLSAVKLVPPGERPVWGSSLLVMPLLQVLSCSTLMEALTDPQTQAKNQSLATSLLQTIEGDTSSPVQVQGRQQTSYLALFMTNRCLNPPCTFKKTPGLSVMRHIFFFPARSTEQHAAHSSSQHMVQRAASGHQRVTPSLCRPRSHAGLALLCPVGSSSVRTCPRRAFPPAQPPDPQQ